jgi:hypothetical protein
MAKTVSIILGILFIVIGILGYFNNPILGYFAVNSQHNLVHILTGFLLLIASMGHLRSTSTVLKVFGVIYLLIAVLGFVQVGSGAILRVIAINAADNWLHLLLGVIMLALGFFVDKRKETTTTPSTEAPSSM